MLDRSVGFVEESGLHLKGMGESTEELSWEGVWGNYMIRFKFIAIFLFTLLMQTSR